MIGPIRVAALVVEDTLGLSVHPGLLVVDRPVIDIPGVAVCAVALSVVEYDFSSKDVRDGGIRKIA